MTITLIALTLALELLYRVYEYGELDSKTITTTTIVNVVAVVIYLILTFMMRCTIVASWFVCPTLTALTYYYFAFVDYDATDVSIYYSTIAGITVTFFLLIVFNEVWLFSTIVYAPMLVIFM